MSEKNAYCPRRDCFANSRKNNCKTLLKPYENPKNCPFFKTNEKLNEELEAIRRSHKLYIDV